MQDKKGAQKETAPTHHKEGAKSTRGGARSQGEKPSSSNRRSKPTSEPPKNSQTPPESSPKKSPRRKPRNQGGQSQHQGEVAAAIAKDRAEIKPQLKKPKQEEDEGTEKDILAANSESKTQLTPKDKRAKWAQYMRTFETPDSRQARTDKFPESLALRIISDKDRSQWFPTWLKYGKSWAKVEISEEFQRIQSTTLGEVDQWLTESQLEDLYKSQKIAKAIVDNKSRSRKTWRPHPEAPHLTEAKQYMVSVCSSKKKLIAQLHKQKICIRGEMEAEGASGMIDEMRKQPSSSNKAEPETDDEPSAPSGGGDNGTDDGSSSASSGSDSESHNKPEKDATKAEKQAKKDHKQGKKGARKEERRRKKEAARAAKKERQRKSKEAKEEAQKRKDQDKLDKEEFKRSPAGKAEAWIKEAGKDLIKCNEMLDDIKTTTKMPRAIQQAWSVTIAEYMQKLKDMRAKMETVREQGKAAKAIEVAKAEELSLSVKRDFKACSSLLKVK